MKKSILLALLIVFAITCKSQNYTVIIISVEVGEEFDATEKAKYHLFPYFPAKDFVSAQFIKLPEGEIVIRAKMKDGSVRERASSQSEVDSIRSHIKKENSNPIRSGIEGTDTLSIYIITMNDESTFHGKIVERDKTTLKVESKTLGIITIKLADIKDLNKIEKTSIRGGKYWFPNPNTTRYLFGPTAIPLKRGEGYYQNIYVFINSFHVGITDNISIGAGLEPISFTSALTDGNPPPFYLTCKAAFPLAEKVHIGGGVLFLSFLEAYSGILFGVGTYGSEENNITLGAGYGFVDDELAESPIFTISGMTRVGRKIALVTENWLLPRSDCQFNFTTGQSTNCRTTYNPQISYAIRVMENKITWDIGFISNNEIVSSSPIGIPYVDFVVKF